MVLEQMIQEVSNRPSMASAKAKQYSAEIKEATTLIKDKKILQEKSDSPKEKLIKPVEELDELKLDYALLEDQNFASVDYDSLFSYLEHKNNSSEESYQQEAEVPEQTSSVMTDGEAEETIKKIQLSYLTGNKDDVSYEEKEKFHLWQEFNKSLLIMLYHHLSPIRTDNVDYARFN